MKQTNDKGFTLIELLVVILIIAILAAVGIVALLGAIRAGQDSAAKQTMEKAGIEIRTQEIDGIFEGDTPLTAEQLAAKMNEVSPDFTWQATTISGDPTNVITIDAFGDNLRTSATIFGTKSKSGKCIFLYLNPITKKSDSGIEKSRINMISKAKYDTCALLPETSGNGPDFNFFDTY
jgi:prepilin-type N-terminal cleavage/methylation domain-containing protein